MVPERHLFRIQGANETLNGILNIGGPPLGALLLAILPYHAIMELDVATAAFADVPLFFNASISIIPLLVTEHFKGDAIQLGWLNSGFGIGVIVGGLVLTIWGGFNKRILTILTG